MVFFHNTGMKGARELTTSEALSPPTEVRTVFCFLSDLFRFLALVVPAEKEREEEAPTEDS
jgi:hypothetical protein